MCFFWKQEPPAGLHHTEDRAVDAPKPIQSGSARIYFQLIADLFQNYFKLTLDLHVSIFRKSSENLDDMGLGCARVPKIIPMQVQGGLRGPSPYLEPGTQLEPSHRQMPWLVYEQ